jgi:hypothetical protein
MRVRKSRRETNPANPMVYNSTNKGEPDKSETRQHPQGGEKETPKKIFEEEKLKLRELNGDQRKDGHFFQTPPPKKKRAANETPGQQNGKNKGKGTRTNKRKNIFKNILG